LPIKPLQTKCSGDGDHQLGAAPQHWRLRLVATQRVGFPVSFLQTDVGSVVMVISEVFAAKPPCCSLRGMTWSNRSRRALPIQPSAIPFCHGLRTLVRIGLIQLALRNSRTSPPNLAVGPQNHGVCSQNAVAYSNQQLAFPLSESVQDCVTPCYKGDCLTEFILSLLAVIRVFLCSRADTAIEVLALRHQVAVLKRQRPRPTLNYVDRLFSTTLRRFWSRWRDVLVIVKRSPSSVCIAPASACTGVGARDEADADRRLQKRFVY
jgi:hypothetical protein